MIDKRKLEKNIPYNILNPIGVEALIELLELIKHTHPKLPISSQIMVIGSLLLNFLSKAESFEVFKFLYKKSLTYNYRFNPIDIEETLLEPQIRLYLPFSEEESDL